VGWHGHGFGWYHHRLSGGSLALLELGRKPTLLIMAGMLTWEWCWRRLL